MTKDKRHLIREIHTEVADLDECLDACYDEHETCAGIDYSKECYMILKEHYNTSVLVASKGTDHYKLIPCAKQ